jgi:hypothetical protein
MTIYTIADSPTIGRLLKFYFPTPESLNASSITLWAFTPQGVPISDPQLFIEQNNNWDTTFITTGKIQGPFTIILVFQNQINR